MRVKINGEDIDHQKITIETFEAKTSTAIIVIIVGMLMGIGWWYYWS